MVELEVADVDPRGAERLRDLGEDVRTVGDVHLHALERGGTLTLLVSGEDEARRAASLLGRQGYGVVVSAVLDEG